VQHYYVIKYQKGLKMGFNSITLLFPGQGSQYTGMGRSLEGKKSFNLIPYSDKILGYELSKLMLEGPEDQLNLTENTQPAIVTHSLAILEELNNFLKNKPIKIRTCLGHSVGEYSALVACGTLSSEDAIKAVHHRGKFMQKAVPLGKGKMVAILKVPDEIIKKACQESSTKEEQVMPANFNEPGQIVISGHAEATDRVVQWLDDNYKEPFRSVPLKVSAPFHSSLMAPAAQQLKKYFKNINFNPSKIDYLANIDSKKYLVETPGEVIQNNLINQVEGSVLWTQSFQKIPEDSLCLEVGPSKILTGLGRKINRSVKVLPLDSDDAFSKLEKLLS
jgi:[acyl-carrier-protein] S-malonyltransferase